MKYKVSLRCLYAAICKLIVYRFILSLCTYIWFIILAAIQK